MSGRICQRKKEKVVKSSLRNEGKSGKADAKRKEINGIVKEYTRKNIKTCLWKKNAKRNERKLSWKLCHKKRKSYELFVKEFDGRKRRNICGRMYKKK